MLQNQQQTKQPAAPGQIRITPEELSQAVAAIERRQEAEAQRLAGTIPIEEAVSNLDLDATPEEIWAEVQSQRDAEAVRQTAAGAAQAAVRPRQAQGRSAVTPKRVRKPWRLVLPIVALSTLYVTGVVHFVGHHAHSAPPALTATVAQITDGKEFYTDSAGLIQISEGNIPTQVHVDAAHRFGNSWTLVKMAGHVYLRAYTAPLASVLDVKGRPLVVFNDDNSGALQGERTAQTTLRVDNIPLQISGGDEDYSQVTVPDFQPDSFTTTRPWR